VDSTFGRPNHLFPRILIVLVLVVPSTLAQQPQSQPPAPAPVESQADKNKNGKEEHKKTADDQTGKSKLEKETGTVNDRIFEVLPNYGTVETSKTFHRSPLGRNFGRPPQESSTGPHFRFNGTLAAISQARGDPKSWGQGWGAYGKRYGESFAGQQHRYIHDHGHFPEFAP
jgi:hypothetical protein